MGEGVGSLSLVFEKWELVLKYLMASSLSWERKDQVLSFRSTLTVPCIYFVVFAYMCAQVNGHEHTHMWNPEVDIGSSLALHLVFFRVFHRTC